MDSTISTTTAINANKIDEILSISPTAAGTATGINGSSERECLVDDEGIEGENRLLKNLPLIINNSLISDNEQIRKERDEIINGNQEQSNNNHVHQTPTATITTINSCQSKPIYNEFVNHVYEASNNNKKKINNSNNHNNKNSLNNHSNNDKEDEDEEIKPLLKSIVKSNSGNLRPSLPLNGTVKTKSKRLSWQASTNPTRYPLNNNNNNPLAVQNGENTQSTSLDSSDEQATGQNEESPSSPITSSSSSSSSSSDDDEFSEVVFQAPDGGYGWLIVFVSFLINMIADGITFSFGVFNVEFLKYFGDSKGKTAWISSIFMATPLLSGPIASYLTDRYGCRKVTIVGAITASIGFLLSAVSNSMEMLFVTFGIIAGFGLSLCYVAAVVIVAYYFDKKRSFATGISVCGSGIGTFLFPPLIQYLITHYGWRGCTVFLAGILLNMCVCGALMRDLEWTTHRARQKRKHQKKLKENGNSSYDSFSITNSTNTGGPGFEGLNDNGVDTSMIEAFAQDDPHLFSSLVNLPTFVKNGEKIPFGVLEQLAKNRNFHDVLLHNYPHLLTTRSLSASDQITTSNDHAAINMIVSPTTMTLSSNRQNKKHRHTIQIGESETDVADKWLRHHEHHHHHHQHHRHVMDILKDLKIHRHSLTYRGAMLNINKYRLRASSCPDIYRNSMTTIASDTTSTAQQMFSEFKKLFKDILDFSYFLDIQFLLFAISNFILYTWYDVVYVYLPDFALENNVQDTDASMLISLIGIVNMLGEIVLGWAGDREEINANIIYAICMGLCGVSVVLIPFFNSYTWMSILSSAFGLFIAANYSLTSIILVNLVDLDRFTNAYGLLLLVQGIANLVGPPIAGMTSDITGNYNLAFFLAGGFIILSGALLMILPILKRYKKFQRRRKESKAEVISNGDVNENSKMNGVYV
ncbi:monocarboxylate transporter 14-like [Chironomus tepperi]|uniref:monocarboxylate transporter 14-like n=1 Tax=Chironomus tepperi TaxID=113505 RepID=UPI00391F65A4